MYNKDGAVFYLSRLLFIECRLVVVEGLAEAFLVGPVLSAQLARAHHVVNQAVHALRAREIQLKYVSGHSSIKWLPAYRKYCVYDSARLILINDFYLW